MNFDPPGADALTPAEIAELMGIFDDGILTGGQTPPRFHKWVNETVTMFLQFDGPNPEEATALLDIGITVPGTFCQESQPAEDFPHFHQTHAPSYGEGHGRAPRGQRVIGRVPRNHGPNVSCLAALTSDGITAPLVIEGAIDGAVFQPWLREWLLPALAPGTTIVLENLVAWLAQEHGVTVHPDHLRRLLHDRGFGWKRTVSSVAHKRRDPAGYAAKVVELDALKKRRRPA